jgi:hypothetical protein
MSKDLSIERALAPHVDPAWAEALLLELRMLDVPGPRIGAVLAEVEAHVVDSGEAAQDAFGDPVPYARSLGLSPAGATGRSSMVATMLPVTAQVVGMSLTIGGAFALAAGARVTVTSGGLVSAVLFGAALLALVLAPATVLRLLLRSAWVAAALIAAFLVVVALPAALARGTLLTLPPVPTLLAGGVLLIGATAAALWSALRTDPDLVTSPVPGTRDPGKPSWALVVLPHLMVPVATLALAAVALAAR